MNHRHQFADPSQRGQQVVEHAAAQLVEPPEIFQSALFALLPALAGGAGRVILRRGERFDGASLGLCEEAVQLADPRRLAPPGRAQFVQPRSLVDQHAFRPSVEAAQSRVEFALDLADCLGQSIGRIDRRRRFAFGIAICAALEQQREIKGPEEQGGRRATEPLSGHSLRIAERDGRRHSRSERQIEHQGRREAHDEPPRFDA